MPNNINLSFLRGTQAGLDALKTAGTIQEGAFYLTTDTHRLYTGIKAANNTVALVELNQSIQEYASLAAIEALSSSALKDGQFYYARQENVLAVYNSTTTPVWTQINPDTNYFLTNLATTVTPDSVTNSVEIAPEATNSYVNRSASNAITAAGSTYQPNVNNASFTLKGKNNVQLSKDNSGNIINIGVNSYSTTMTTGEGEATLKLQTTSSDTGATPSDVSSVKFINGTNTNVVGNSTNGTIAINATDTVLNTSSGSLGFSNQGVLSFGVSDTGNHSAGGNTTPIIKVGNSVATLAEDYKFISGTATLPVYTKTEVNELVNSNLSSYNALTFVGPIADTLSIPSRAHNGDVYILTNDVGNYKAKDLLIATGTEVTDTASQDFGYITNIDWVHVPSGDDTVGFGYLNDDTTDDDPNAIYNGYIIKQNNINLKGIRTVSQSDNLKVYVSEREETNFYTTGQNHLTTAATNIALVWDTFGTT